MEEARSSTTALSSQVQQVLMHTRSLQARLESTKAQSTAADPQEQSSDAAKSSDDDNSTIIPARTRAEDNSVEVKTRNSGFDFTFDKELRASRVYRRTMCKPNRESLTSSVVFSLGWSFLSGLSLGDISNVSVLALPISPEELWNFEHYNESPQKSSTHGLPLKPRNTDLEIGIAITTPQVPESLLLLGKIAYHWTLKRIWTL